MLHQPAKSCGFQFHLSFLVGLHGPYIGPHSACAKVCCFSSTGAFYVWGLWPRTESRSPWRLLGFCPTIAQMLREKRLEETMGMKQVLAAAAVALAFSGMASAPARADLKLCNNSTGVVHIAVGYKDKEGWASDGWWTVNPNACSSILKGALIARYYYIYAVDDKK